MERERENGGEGERNGGRERREGKGGEGYVVVNGEVREGGRSMEVRE